MTDTDARGLLRGLHDAFAALGRGDLPTDIRYALSVKMQDKIDAFLTAASVGVPEEPKRYVLVQDYERGWLVESSGVGDELIYARDYDTLRTALAAARSEALEETINPRKENGMEKSMVVDEERGARLVGPHGGLKEKMPNPTEADLDDPLFNAVWNATKTWDVNAPEYYVGYCGMNGSHVMLIVNAIRALKNAGGGVAT